jgi:hypothetical protein
MRTGLYSLLTACAPAAAVALPNTLIPVTTNSAITRGADILPDYLGRAARFCRNRSDVFVVGCPERINIVLI